MGELVKGKYFKVYSIEQNDDMLRISNLKTNVEMFVTTDFNDLIFKAKLIDINNVFSSQLDPFNSEMIAELQNCKEFAYNTLRDWFANHKQEKGE